MVVWQYMLYVYKYEGETPLEALEKARILEGIAPEVPMTYAGRLDPMAEGLLMVLVGDECKHKEDYLGLDKVYEFEILVGFATDTADILGLVTASISDIPSDVEVLLANTIPSFVGKQVQSYPAFSSKTSGGVQLFALAKENVLPEVLPSHGIEIYSLEIFGSRSVSKEQLQKDAVNRIGKVSGDFRQDEIISKWSEVFSVSPLKEFTIIQCRAHVSSGTYIRQFVTDISVKIGIPLVTYSIKRTKIGDRSL